MLHREDTTNEKQNVDPNGSNTLVISTQNLTLHTTKQHMIEELALRTILVILKSGNGKMIANSLLDDGSTKTYVNEDIAAELKLAGSVEKVQVNDFEDMSVEMELQSLDGRISTKINAFTANRVTGDMTVVDWKPTADKWKHLRNIQFPKLRPRPFIDIFIGIDYIDLHCATEEIKGKPGEPIVRRTPLGWTCVGNLQGQGTNPHHFNFVRTFNASSLELEKIDLTLKKF